MKASQLTLSSQRNEISNDPPTIFSPHTYQNMNTVRSGAYTITKDFKESYEETKQSEQVYEDKNQSYIKTDEQTSLSLPEPSYENTRDPFLIEDQHQQQDSSSRGLFVNELDRSLAGRVINHRSSSRSSLQNDMY